MQTNIYIGLGSNLAQPLQQLQQAIAAMVHIPETKVIRLSSLYRSRPMGPQDQPDYVNGVVELASALTPRQLLKELQKIELQQGRVRKANRWGPRTLDLDILLFGQQIIADQELTIPHYGMQQREFVLYPLAQIAAKLQLPDGQSLAQLLANCPLNGLTKLDIDLDSWFSTLKSV